MINRIEDTPGAAQPGLGRSAAQLVHDLVSLAELQAQLVSLDIKSAGQRIAAASVSFTIAALLALSSLTAALIGAGWWLADGMSWSGGAGVLLVAGVGFAIAGGLAWLGWRRSHALGHCFDRSRQELQESVKAIKQAMHGMAEEERSY